MASYTRSAETTDDDLILDLERSTLSVTFVLETTISDISFLLAESIVIFVSSLIRFWFRGPIFCLLLLPIFCLRTVLFQTATSGLSVMSSMPEERSAFDILKRDFLTLTSLSFFSPSFYPLYSVLQCQKLESLGGYFFVLAWIVHLTLTPSPLPFQDQAR